MKQNQSQEVVGWQWDAPGEGLLGTPLRLSVGTCKDIQTATDF